VHKDVYIIATRIWTVSLCFTWP